MTNNSTIFLLLNQTCPNKMVFKHNSVRLITGYAFLPLFVVGVIGNVLNLFVLNARGMRSKTNALLSAMAMSDLCFLLLLFPMELFIYDIFNQSHNYMVFYVTAKFPFSGLINCFSAASNWIAVLVTMERVIAIKAPLTAKYWWKTSRIILTLALIYAFSFVAAFYNFVWVSPVIKSYCNDTVHAYSYKAINKNDTPALDAYVQLSLLITPFFIVVVPTFFLVILNSCLLFYLYANRRVMTSLAGKTTQQQQGVEWRVALTVSIIVLSFILFTTPSAISIIYEGFYPDKRYRTSWHNQAVLVANLLVTVCKSVNFILYCSSSRHFRRRLIAIVLCVDERRRRNSSMYETSSNARRRSTMTSMLDVTAVDSTRVQNFLNSLRNRAYAIRKSTIANGGRLPSPIPPHRHSVASNGNLRSDKQQETRILIDPYHRSEFQHHAERKSSLERRRHTHPVDADSSLERLVAEKGTRRKLGFVVGPHHVHCDELKKCNENREESQHKNYLSKIFTTSKM